MADYPSLLVFSDLDGTLLDHHTYSWDAAKPALATLRDIGAGLILASSKTAAEMRVIQAELGLSGWPAIVENGAGVLTDEPTGTSDYDMIRAAIALAPYRDCYRGFGDMTADEVAEVTGLSPEAAALAKTRAFSEPGIWSGPDDALPGFRDHLQGQGIIAREGGRFLTFSMGKTKADQMMAIIAQYQPQHTIALGDAPNDIEMLETADYGVIVANPHRDPLHTLAGEDSGQIIRTVEPGPVGWNQAVLSLVHRLIPDRNGPAHG